MVRSYPLIPMGGENKLHGVVALEILNNICEFKKKSMVDLRFWWKIREGVEPVTREFGIHE